MTGPSEPETRAAEEGVGGGARIVSVLLTLLIGLVMFGVHTFMKYGHVNAISSKHERNPESAHSARPGSDRWCTLTTQPEGATAHAIEAEGPEALGVTPLEVQQGAYTIRLELEGHRPLEIEVGLHPEPCELAHTLEPIP